MTVLKILVLSDSHRTMRYMEQAVSLERPDYIIHLGDHSRDAEALHRRFPGVPLASVRGNCDYDSTAPEQLVGTWGGVRFLLTHGHRYGVKTGLLRLSMAAREAGVDVALFGHTHRAFCELSSGVWLLNPGSCGAGCPTYGTVTIENKTPLCAIHTFDEMESTFL